MTSTLLSLVLCAGPSPLPLTRVTFYQNGVGYFERGGDVPAGQVVELPVGPGQLDDALKSMVILSQRGVASIEYAPPVSPEAARTTAGMPDESTQGSLFALVRAMKGAEAEVRLADGGVLLGRIIEISDDEKRLDDKGLEHPEPMLLLFGAAGLQKMPLRVVSALKPTEAGFGSAWQRALQAVAERQGTDALQIRGGQGGGAVSVGYTTEAPVWRTTYRLLSRDGSARLQGFGVVHNDTDEAWRDVEVTLASGRPTSFVFPLAGPRYERRDVVSPDDGLEASPQLVQPEVRDLLRGGSTTFSVALGARGTGSGGGGYGAGSGAGFGSLTGTAGGRVEQAAVLADGPTPLEPAAVSEAGDLFFYRVLEPVTLGPKKSALLPIIDSSVTAEKVTLINVAGAAASGLRVLNSTPYTLEQGTVSVFIDGHYGGETRIDRLKPKEVRTLAHGEDLDIEAKRERKTKQGPVRTASFVGPTLYLKRLMTTEHHLSIRSRSAQPRIVLVELGRDGARLTRGAIEDERSVDQPRYARFSLPPKATIEKDLIDEGGIEETVAAASLTVERFDQVLASPLLAKGDAARLMPLRSLVGEIDATQTKRQAASTRVGQATAEIKRLRDSAGALQKTAIAEAARSLGTRLVDREAELAELTREQSRLASQLDSLVKRLMQQTAQIQ